MLLEMTSAGDSHSQLIIFLFLNKKVCNWKLCSSSNQNFFLCVIFVYFFQNFSTFFSLGPARSHPWASVQLVPFKVSHLNAGQDKGPTCGWRGALKNLQPQGMFAASSGLLIWFLLALHSPSLSFSSHFMSSLRNQSIICNQSLYVAHFVQFHVLKKAWKACCREKRETSN